MGIILLTVPAGLAQIQDLENIKFERITSENIKIEKGLSQNSIQCILQDKTGYMWFGTWDGLNKYDGYRFTIFDKENKISGQTVNCMIEDSDGYLWIGTDEGLDRYDRTINEFTEFKHNPYDPRSLVNDFITAIIEDTTGCLWIGTQGGLSKYDKKTRQFESFLNKPLDNTPLKSNYINSLCFDRQGFLWIATRIGLIRLDTQTLIVIRLFNIHDDKHSLPDNFVKSILCDHNGNIWTGTNRGLGKLNPANFFFENYFQPTEITESQNAIIINTIYEDNQGLLWIGTDSKGLRIFNPSSGETVQYDQQGYDVSSLSNNRVLCIYEDRVGTMWIGTFIGINKFNRHTNRFSVYRNVSNDNNSLNSNYIMSLYEDKNQKVWIATNKGINILNRKTGQFRHIMHITGDTKSLVSDNLRVITGDRSGLLWIGTQNEGLESYDPVKNRFTHYSYDLKNKFSLSSNDVLSIYEDSYGMLWIGTGHGGLNMYDRATNKFISFKNNPEDSTSLSSNRIWTIYEDRERNLWVGTGDGINLYHRDSHTFVSFRCRQGHPNGPNAREIFCICQDSGGIFWIGTKGGGLNRFDKESGEFSYYTEKNDLPNNIIYSIMEDENGFLWLTTNWGLSKFDPRKENFINYDVQDGLQSNEFNLGAYYKNDRGEMYVGGMNGFNLFQPSEIKTNPLKPKTVITSFKVFNREIENEFIDGQRIRLSANNNFFTIEFSALDFTNPAKNKYQFILENYDKMWSSVTSDKRFADYTNVRPGIYYFRVIGSNNDGIWDDKGVTLTIIIKPHWYHTWFFRIPVLLIAIFTLWYLINRRIRIIRDRHEVEKKVLAIEKQLYDTELQALRLQMNPHFIFNTLNSIQSFILTKNTDMAVNYLGKFSQLMRLILTHSTEDTISIEEELRALRYYLDIEMLRFENKFTYTIHVDPAIDEEFTEVPPMIVQPYVENAIIHGLMHKKGERHIKITLKLEDNSILWIIEDNGIGRDRAMQIQKESGLQRKSRGMLITMERLEVLHRKNNENFSIEVIDLKDENDHPIGTRVELRMAYRES
jgi:ligand-binding sensor domain-containing protein/two-component sensor histidine kinase